MYTQRKRLRLKDFDYSSTGYYFVTICTFNKLCIFGKIHDNKIILDRTGQTVEQSWQELPTKFPNVQLDYYQIMPNHLHGIVIIQNNGNKMGMMNHAPTKGSQPSLSEIIRAYKAKSAFLMGKLDIPKPIWQRSYYEHVIRNEEDLERIRDYIENNPRNWAEDEENPRSVKSITLE